MSKNFTEHEFRNACGQFVTGVTIVTTSSKTGDPIGITANSFTSVSLDPPLILVCLDKGLNSYDDFINTEGFAVHILTEEQEGLSNLFARRGEDKFKDIKVNKGLYDAPIIPDVLTVFECEVYQKIDSGDHMIFVGKVQRLTNQLDQNKPLGFVNGKYINLNEKVKNMEGVK